MLPVHSRRRFLKKAFRLNLAANKSFPLNKFNSKKIHFQEKASLAKKIYSSNSFATFGFNPVFYPVGEKALKAEKIVALKHSILLVVVTRASFQK